MSVGKKVKFHRNKAKLTQVELAEIANISRSYLADIERDRYNPSIETLRALSEALKISIHSLIDGEENPDNLPIPEWATSKDKRDFKKMLEEDAEVQFDGVPLSDEDKEKIKRVMEAMFWDAKKMNKRKTTDK
jgi:transcriptional regulator with XRE-family HTH domain